MRTTEKIKALKRHEKDKTQSQVHTQQKEKKSQVQNISAMICSKKFLKQNLASAEQEESMS